jgi:aubergine-like protein
MTQEVIGDNKVKYRIGIRLVGLVQQTDPVYLQFYNILLRKCMSLLKLEEMGRNFYDRSKRISIPEGKLELWPGFATAIRHHEAGLFLCVEITHKVLRTASVMDEINDLYNRLQSNPRKVTNELGEFTSGCHLC